MNKKDILGLICAALMFLLPMAMCILVVSSAVSFFVVLDDEKGSMILNAACALSLAYAALLVGTIIYIAITDRLRKKRLKKELEKSNAILDKAYEEAVLSNEEFARFIKDAFIRDGEYVLDTGSDQNVNAEVALRLKGKEDELHDLFWK